MLRWTLRCSGTAAPDTAMGRAPILPGTLVPASAAEREGAMLGKRALRDPSTYSGANDGSNCQPNWYAMRQRALMNADCYAQFILTATGYQAPCF